MRTCCLIVVLGFVCLMGMTLPAVASYQDYFPVQGATSGPGFQHAPPLRADDTPPGLAMTSQRAFHAGTTIGNVNGNLSDGLEVVVAGQDGIVTVYSRYGVKLWATQIYPAACPEPPAGDTKIASTAAIGAIYGDGIPYVVIGYGTINQTACPGGVVAIRGTNGVIQWRYEIPALAINDFNDGVASSPALGDTDGDGNLEVAFGAFDRDVYFLEHTGTLRWKYEAFDTVWSSPAFANIDNDSRLEMIIGTDITRNDGLGTPNGGYVYAFDTNLSGTINFNTGYIWRNTYNQTIYSSPLVTDLERDGKLEVVVGSGCFYNRDIGAGRWVKVLNASTGSEISTLNALNCSTASPAVGDIDDDGILEIVNITNGSYVGQPFSWVQAWDHTNPNPKWTTVPISSLGSHNPSADDMNSVMIADLDGNGSLEVALAYSSDIVVLNGKTGTQLTCNGFSCGATRSMFGWTPIASKPAIADMDLDGDLDLAVGGHHIGAGGTGTANGYVYAWTDFAGKLGSPVGTQPAYSAPWPVFRGNPQHTGYFRNAKFVGSNVGALMEPNDTRTATFTFASSDRGQFAWSISKTDPDNRISLSQTSGTSGGTAMIQLTLNANNTAPDVYTGSLTITGNNFPPLTITITITTVDNGTIQSVFVPVMRK